MHAFKASLLAGVAGLLQLLAMNAVHAQTTNFAYTGSVQTYTIPPGAGGITISAGGAGGGGGGSDASGNGFSGAQIALSYG